jgi:hypothetical protein
MKHEQEVTKRETFVRKDAPGSQWFGSAVTALFLITNRVRIRKTKLSDE